MMLIELTVLTVLKVKNLQYAYVRLSYVTVSIVGPANVQ